MVVEIDFQCEVHSKYRHLPQKYRNSPQIKSQNLLGDLQTGQLTDYKILQSHSDDYLISNFRHISYNLSPRIL